MYTSTTEVTSYTSLKTSGLTSELAVRQENALRITQTGTYARKGK
jgi:hypothetical protein